MWLMPEMAAVGPFPTASAGSCGLLLTVQCDSNQKNQIKLSGPFPAHPTCAFLLLPPASEMARKPYGSRKGQHSHWLLVLSTQLLSGFLLGIKSLRKLEKRQEYVYSFYLLSLLHAASWLATQRGSPYSFYCIL